MTHNLCIIGPFFYNLLEKSPILLRRVIIFDCSRSGSSVDNAMKQAHMLFLYSIFVIKIRLHVL